MVPFGAGGKKPSVVAVELQLTPTKHVREKERTDKIRLDIQRFQGLLQTLASQKWRSGLRISFREGRGRVLVLGRGKVDLTCATETRCGQHKSNLL